MLLELNNMFNWLRFKLGGRSNDWGRVRKEFLKDNPVCAVCGTKKKLEVHHKIPYNVDKFKELEWDNLIVLCRNCHYMFGHCFLNWQSYNEDIKMDAGIVNSIIINSQEQWKQKITD